MLPFGAQLAEIHPSLLEHRLEPLRPPACEHIHIRIYIVHARDCHARMQQQVLACWCPCYPCKQAAEVNGICLPECMPMCCMMEGGARSRKVPSAVEPPHQLAHACRVVRIPAASLLAAEVERVGVEVGHIPVRSGGRSRRGMMLRDDGVSASPK